MAPNDVQPIIDTTYAAAQPNAIEPDQRYAVVVPGGEGQGSLEIIEPQPDAYRDAPRRVSGRSTVYDVDSLKVLWEKHARPHSEVFGDPERHVITAVLNADEGVGLDAGFRDHTVELVCAQTPSWKAWIAMDGELVDQLAFAEFIEERVTDIAEPSGADMLELAQSFEATTNAQFKSSTILSSGQRGLQFEETIAAKAGQTGQLEIPKEFSVALQPFEGGDRYRVAARFRFRIRNGHLALGFKLDRPEDVVRGAFEDVCRNASEATGAQVLIGKAPASRS
jgi:uncharacterized protein YfdQ (DUF2303 family)